MDTARCWERKLFETKPGIISLHSVKIIAASIFVTLATSLISELTFRRNTIRTSEKLQLTSCQIRMGEL